MASGFEGEQRVSKRLVLWAALTALLFLFVWYAWQVLFLAFAGFLLAIVLRAVTDWLERRTRLGPRSAFAAVVLGLLVLVVLTAWFIVPRILAQTTEMLHLIPGTIEAAKRALDQRAWGREVVRLADRAMMNISIAPKLVGMIHGLTEAAVAIIVIAIVGLYAAAHPASYRDGLLQLVPERYRAEALEVAGDVVYTLRWWVLGQLVPMVVLGVATIIGLRLLGVPLAFTLGIFTGIMIFIPYLGALLSEIPALLMGFAVSPRTALYVLILYLGVHIMEGYILTPLVQKRAVRLLPVVTILTQFLMWQLTGLLGVAIATPLAASGLVLIKRLYLHEKIRHKKGFGA